MGEGQWDLSKPGGGSLGKAVRRRRTVGLVADTRFDADDAVAEASLGGAQACVRGRQVFEVLGQSRLQGRELGRGEGEDVDGAWREVLRVCHFLEDEGGTWGMEFEKRGIYVNVSSVEVWGSSDANFVKGS